MLSYQHGFHAGNFADVHKHSTLTALLSALNRKAKPWSYLESHAGAAMYELGSEASQKTGEYKQGIKAVWSANGLPESLLRYQQLVQGVNEGQLEHYPGSPVIAMDMSRETDKLAVMELHPTEFQKLKAFFSREKQIAVHHRDGYEGVLSLLPPKPNRGVVLIDPAFEVKAEYQQAASHLIKMQSKWPNGSFALWYPVLAAGRHIEMLETLVSSGIRKIYRSEYYAKPDSSARMYGSGMLLINPPWKVDESIQEVTHWMFKNLSEKGSLEPLEEWLVPE